MLGFRTLMVATTVLAALTAAAAGQAYVQVLTPDVMTAGDASLTITRAAVAEGTTVYSFLARSGGLAMTKVTNAGTSPSASTITTLASWTADVGAPSNNRVFTGYGMAVVNGSIQIADGENDTVFRVDKNTGAVSTYVSKAAIQTYIGGAPAINNWSGVSPTGEAVFHENFSKAILQTNGAGGLTTLVTSAELEAAQGTGNLTPSSGLEFDGSGNLYWAENNSDKVYKRATNGTIMSILGPAELSPLIGASITFSGDMTYAPDGWMYMRAGSSGSAQNILKFDPASPASSLQVVLSTADLIAGPAGSSSVLEMSWFDGNLAFTTSGIGYYAVPEPASLALLGLGGLVLIRRR